MASDTGTATGNPPLAREPGLRAEPTDTKDRVAAARPPSARVRRKREGRGRFSPLTRRILTVNVLALAILVAGLLYLGQYRENLIEAELATLRTQGEVFAGALGEGAHGPASSGITVLRSDIAAPMLRRLVLPTRTRARLFDVSGALVADSRVLLGPGGAVQVEVLPPPAGGGKVADLVLNLYDGAAQWFSGEAYLQRYRELPVQRADDYAEVIRALAGGEASLVRSDDAGGMVLSVAVPVQRFKRVLGALMLTTSGREIDSAVRAVRLDILTVFLVAFAVTVLLSLYLAGTIVRPVRRLAAAADLVRRTHGSEHTIPDLRKRGDEIGDLSVTLRDMTEALWQRLDAIESFAADVAHEIKNPLTSLRSAVETAARISDPDQQRRLMSIILEDVQRLDRLISDISDASRLDAELSRAEMERVDLARLLDALAQIHHTAAAEGRAHLVCELPPGDPLAVLGNEGRLVQVFQNLLANAFSFTPEDGEVRLSASVQDGMVEVVVDDTGPGLPENGTERIFERFYSERPEDEQFGKHSGLGLNISRQIVEAHGGTITAANRQARVPGALDTGTGASFTVRLPVV